MFPEKRHRPLRWLKRSNLSILAALTCLVGCTEHAATTVTVVPGAYVHKMDEFLPLNADQKSAQFIVDGTKTDYRLKTVEKGSTVSFQAVSDGTVIDEEIYDVHDRTIFLLKAAGENFEPPVPLLKFPLNVGEEHRWKGSLVCEIERIDGVATISSSTDYVNLKDKSQDALKVEVDLNFGKGGSRKLSFWFVKGKGVLKTEMFKNIREPKV